MVTSPINPMRYWKLEEIQRMLNQIEGYENVVIEFQYQQSDDWTKRKVWECRCGIKEQLVNGQYSWLLKYVFAIEANDEGDARTIAWQEAAERLVTDVWRTSINSLRKQQTINKTNMTDEKTTNMNNTTQTKNDYADGYFDATTTSTNDNTTEQLPMWKRLAKSFVWMMIIMQCCYAVMISLMWLYDTLGIEHVMPTLIGIVLWIVVYDHMYGTASKAPRIQ
jgi:hypothetical protein